MTTEKELKEAVKKCDKAGADCVKAYDRWNEAKEKCKKLRGEGK